MGNIRTGRPLGSNTRQKRSKEWETIHCVNEEVRHGLKLDINQELKFTEGENKITNKSETVSRVEQPCGKAEQKLIPQKEKVANGECSSDDYTSACNVPNEEIIRDGVNYRGNISSELDTPNTYKEAMQYATRTNCKASCESEKHTVKKLEVFNLVKTTKN